MLVYDLDTSEELLIVMTNQDESNAAEGSFVTDWVEL